MQDRSSEAAATPSAKGAMISTAKNVVIETILRGVSALYLENKLYVSISLIRNWLIYIARGARALKLILSLGFRI